MVKAEEEERKKKNKWWWVDNNTIATKSTRSPWLHSTLSDLDEMTKAMLKLIDEDADSFAQRAEMFYKKRPELIAMVEEVYRAHRSLAVQYDQVKQDPGSRLLTKYRSDKLMSFTERSYDSYSETYEQEDSCNSDVDDPEDEVESQLNKGVEVPSDEVIKLKEELEKLKEENRLQGEQLRQRDEEKREAIRQLSFALDMFKEDNTKLRKMVAFTETTKQQKSPFDEFNKFRKVFLGRLFSVSSKKNSES